MPSPELVVIVDGAGVPIGTRDKSELHTTSTPLHLAFSCYLFNSHGDILVTRRALSKQTWPGVWTNSFCGHPAPGESFDAAITRRADRELGASVRDIRGALSDFSYRAVDASGIVENEICPVFTAHLDGEIAAADDEVCEWAWITPEAFETAVAAAPFAFSPWVRKQLPLLIAQGALTRGATNG